MGALFGSRVTPVMNLSPEDVLGYLGLQLQRLNNKRLKIGDLKSDDGTITADIVTVDNSLVQRLKIDRHTGAIQYERTEHTRQPSDRGALCTQADCLQPTGRDAASN